ncbi:hypothetical protein TNCV_5061221 [Trichonephila clavipes]|nr:hypothetical protein TNCV_5061221 [Trichonephila clavipes]
MVPRINTLDDYRQWNSIPSHQLREKCVAVKQSQDWGAHHGAPQTNTIVITAEIESGFVAKDVLVQFRCSQVSSCVAPFQMEASMGGFQGQHT